MLFRSGGISATTISGGTFYGDGSNLTNIDNIYTVDGALLSNRIVDLSGNTLSLKRSSNINDSFLNGVDSSGNTLFEIRSVYHPIEPSLKSLYFGNNSGKVSISNYANTAFGSDALSSVTTGIRNTVFGARSLSALVNGSFNTSIGELAAPVFTGGTGSSGNDNIFIGNGAALKTLTGRYNVIIGTNSYQNNLSGDNNTIIGKGAGSISPTNSSGNVFIGTFAGRFESGSNLLYIDNSSTSTPLIYGDFANDLLRFNGKVGVNIQPSTYQFDEIGRAHV